MGTKRMSSSKRVSWHWWSNGKVKASNVKETKLHPLRLLTKTAVSYSFWGTGFQEKNRLRLI